MEGGGLQSDESVFGVEAFRFTPRVFCVISEVLRTLADGFATSRRDEGPGLAFLCVG